MSDRTAPPDDHGSARPDDRFRRPELLDHNDTTPPGRAYVGLGRKR